MGIYNLVVLLYGLVIKLASFNSAKARQWVKGRKQWQALLVEKCRTLSADRVWVHCASYGEFEQGKPLMQAIRNQFPGKKIILSFFSPSGFESFKNWEGADLVVYLPLDTGSNARRFLDIVQPKAAIFIKYEFWLNYLKELKRRQIRTYLVSATFKPHHPFFKSYGEIFRNSLNTFEIMFLQDAASGELLQKIGFSNYEISGDTRFDRVMEVRNSSAGVDGIIEFKGANRLIVAGSTWPRDEEMLLEAFKELRKHRIKLVMAPHHVSAADVKECTRRLERSGFSYCEYTQGIKNDSEILLIDTIGILSRVYRYADCAYVGGGFDEGIHNTLEPAVYGIPLAFYGEDYSKYNEAVSLVSKECAVEVKNAGHLKQTFFSWLDDVTKLKVVKEKLENYFALNSRVTERIMQKIKL